MHLLTLIFECTEKTTSLQEPVNPDMLDQMRTGAANSFTGVPQRPQQENDSIPKIAPKWLKHDRQVSYSGRDYHSAESEWFLLLY